MSDFPRCHHGLSTAYTCERCKDDIGAKSFLELLAMQPKAVVANGVTYIPHPDMPGTFVPESRS